MPTTTIYNRGAVVLLPFPFSDQSAAKIRPAVIVSPHYPSDDLLVVAVTSIGETLRPGEFPIQYWREAGSECSLSIAWRRAAKERASKPVSGKICLMQVVEPG